MNQTGNERDLQLANRYLDEHFNPIRRLLGQTIPNPEVRATAIRRCTRHISHWKREVLGNPVRANHPDYGEPGKPQENGEGDRPSDQDEEDIPSDQRPPEQWATGEDPATPQ